ncbi:carboxypeptidase-like regulatory domain-containing protein [Rasiella sp. SM2506]|uniref:carboxypeptidase-like regulatory domain-containing protein n=1 Tax=Rasiella sp. SM2506 TaxID=3423914 RepID=UPI003D798704
MERVQVIGKISASQDEDKEGVSIYNKSSQKGTLSDAEGNFTIAVGVEDIIVITALQFQTFTAKVTQSILQNKTLTILLNTNINRLDEVLLRSHTLTGIIDLDAKNIEVFVAPKLELGYGVNASFAPDRFSRIEKNIAQEALGYGTMSNGVNVGALLGLAFTSLFPKKDKKDYTDPFAEIKSQRPTLQDKYSAQYYSATFKIPLEQVNDFIYFVTHNVATWHLLGPENEMQLLKVLFEQSERYKKKLETEE